MFLPQMISQLCFPQKDCTKIVRLILAAVSINGLRIHAAMSCMMIEHIYDCPSLSFLGITYNSDYIIMTVVFNLLLRINAFSYCRC